MNKRAENYDVGTLENKVVIEIKEAQSEVRNLIGSLNQLTTAINNSINTTKTNKLKNGLQEISKEMDQMNAKSRLFKKAFGLGVTVFALKKAYGFAKDLSKEYIDMIETNNLFEVSMGKVVDEYGNLDTASSKYYLKAMQFQDKMNEKLATNKTELKGYQAMYYNMLTAQGIDKNSSYLMSESLTKAGYDIASLYNLDVQKAMEKLQSGLAGQVKSLRDIGIDISESSLEKVLSEVGIDRSVEKLSYAEKEVARYIAILNQAGRAQGDFAKTFEQPANQIKVFKNQLAELKQLAGSFITNAFGGILVYANAIVMALKEILKFFATLFGYDLTSGGSTNLSETIGANDLAEDLRTSAGNAKKLKNILMGFDEINNITLPENSGLAGTIDDKLLKALKEWDNQMDSISGKAQQIRDNILDWLGFTKDVHGNLKWSWEDMNGIAKTLTIIAGIVAGITIIGKITKTITLLQTLFKILATGEGATTTFGLGLQTIGKFLNSGKTNISDFITYFKILKSEGVSTGTALTTSFGEVWKSIGTGTKLLIGAGGLIGSCSLASQTMKDLSNETIGTSEAFAKMTISLAGATASGAMIGSIFGPAGTAIGALAGALIDLSIASTQYQTEAEKEKRKLKEVQERVDASVKSWNELKNKMQENIDNGVAIQEYHKMLVDELEQITEANGKVKKGYEERVSFILNELSKAYGIELKLSDGQITKNGEIVKSIQEITDNIREQIETKKAQLILEANEQLYSEALKNKTQAYKDWTAQTEAYNTALEKTKDIMDKHSVSLDEVINKTDKYRIASLNMTFNELGRLDNLRDVVKEYDKAKKQYEEYSKSIIYWEELQTAIITGSTEKQKKAIELYTNSYVENGETREMSLKEEMEMTKTDLDLMKKIYEENGKEINEEIQASMDSRIKTVASKLVEGTQTVEDLTDENKEAWRVLSQESTNIYAEYLEKIPEIVRREIQAMTGVFIEKTPELENVIRDMSDKMLDKLDNSEDMKKTAVQNVKAYLSGLTEKQQRDLLNKAGIENVDKVIKGLKQGDLSEDVGINIIKGLRKGLQNDYWQGRTLSAVTSFANSVLRSFKSMFGIQSPSKKTRQFGIYLLEGLGIGIEKEENSVLKTVSDFSNRLLNKMNNTLTEFTGIQVSAKDASIDATSYVNYGTIRGNISANSNVTVGNNIIEGIAEAVSNSMKNAELSVDLDVRADEGIIVKKASQGFKEYIRQTGELPFPVPIS